MGSFFSYSVTKWNIKSVCCIQRTLKEQWAHYEMIWNDKEELFQYRYNITHPNIVREVSGLLFIAQSDLYSRGWRSKLYFNRKTPPISFFPMRRMNGAVSFPLPTHLHKDRLIRLLIGQYQRLARLSKNIRF